jgi:ribosome-associated toxin RatA of RatAB toxin-antitoxin module
MARILFTRLAGGHRAPRLPFVLAFGALLCSPLSAVAEEARRAPGMVTVSKADGVYLVRAQFAVPQPADEVLAVLTDYDGIPLFLPDIRRSVVRSRDGARAVVEQEAVSGMMLFSKTVHLLLDIEESPEALVFKDTCGRSFDTYEGAWRLARVGDATEVRYELRAKPAFAVPDFVLRRLLKRDSRETITRIAGEIGRRARPTAFTAR